MHVFLCVYMVIKSMFILTLVSLFIFLKIQIFSLVQKPDGMQIRANLVTGIIALLGLIRLASSTFQVS